MLDQYEAIKRRFSERVGEEPEQKTPQTEAIRRESELREIHRKAREHDNAQDAAQDQAVHEK